MNKIFKLISLSIALGTVSGSAYATAPTTYILTITNGSAMPVSPIAVYAQRGQIPKAQIGAAPTAGFVQLCQTGSPMTRIAELGMNADVTFKAQTSGPLFPGESLAIEVEVADPLQQSIQFETMYGKTKDLCAVGGISSHSLHALKLHVTSSVLGKDNVVQTGAFLDPAIPMGMGNPAPQVCNGVLNAVSCLRSLARPNPNPAKIRFFSGYLSSLMMLLEATYGAEETSSLMVPTSGAVQYELKLKH